MFRTWYKVKKEETAPEGTDTADNGDFIFRERTIPPIPGVHFEPGNPELVSYYPKGTSSAAAEKAREAAEAEKEAEAEAERLEMMVCLSCYETKQFLPCSSNFHVCSIT